MPVPSHDNVARGLRPLVRSRKVRLGSSLAGASILTVLPGRTGSRSAIALLDYAPRGGNLRES